MALYKVTFSTCLYKKDKDGIFRHIGNRADGSKLFTDISKPENWEFYKWHPKPARPKNADSIMYVDSVVEYHPILKRWEPIMSTSY